MALPGWQDSFVAVAVVSVVLWLYLLRRFRWPSTRRPRWVHLLVVLVLAAAAFEITKLLPAVEAAEQHQSPMSWPGLVCACLFLLAFGTIVFTSGHGAAAQVGTAKGQGEAFFFYFFGSAFWLFAVMFLGLTLTTGFATR